MKKLFIPLSGEDVDYFLEDPNIVLYKDLTDEKIKNMKNGDHLFILLPIRSHTDGHWILFEKIDGKYYYFDSYGKPCDSMLKPKFGLDPILKKYKPITNKVCYQKGETTTCGRHCIFKLFMKKKYDIKTHRQYECIMKKISKLLDLTPDEIVTTFINRDIVK